MFEALGRLKEESEVYEGRYRLQMLGSQSTDSTDNVEDKEVRQVCANGICMKTTDVEAKLDEGNIQEAESSLREGLSLNFEVGSC